MFRSTLPVQANKASLLAEVTVVEQRLVVIAQELRCLACQNESLAGWVLFFLSSAAANAKLTHRSSTHSSAPKRKPFSLTMPSCCP